MTTEHKVLWAIFLLAGVGLLYKGLATESGLGAGYVAEIKPPTDADERVPSRFVGTVPTDPERIFSWSRTIGLWLSAFFTLSIMSYLYRDNVFFKLTEAIIVGVSAGYLMVVGFWDNVVRDLVVQLAPDIARAWAVPSVPADQPIDWTFVVPLLLGLMLFLQFFRNPVCRALAQWPLAFVVGTFAGLKLVLYLEADFVNQIENSLVPLVVMTDGTINVVETLRNTGLVLSLLASLSYFVFSVRHAGVFGWCARLGVWVLMVTFGAAFAFTVMGRITLLTMRLEFLFRDWLRLI